MCADDTTLYYNLNNATKTITLDNKTVYKYGLTIVNEIFSNFRKKNNLVFTTFRKRN